VAREDMETENPQEVSQIATSKPHPSTGLVRFLPRSSGQRMAVAGLLLFIVFVGACIYGQVAGWKGDDANHRHATAQRTPGKLHSRPIIERDGKSLLWALGKPDSPDAEWFDVTESKIDPKRFQYGIGKDKIASIDSPRFVDADDPRLRRARIGDQTRVIGYVHNGDARAYPLHILDHHELVNDTVGGKPVTVGW